MQQKMFVHFLDKIIFTLKKHKKPSGNYGSSPKKFVASLIDIKFARAVTIELDLSVQAAQNVYAQFPL